MYNTQTHTATKGAPTPHPLSPTHTPGRASLAVIHQLAAISVAGNAALIQKSGECIAAAMSARMPNTVSIKTNADTAAIS
jgi:hypothetical protein